MTEFSCCEKCCGFRAGFTNFKPLSSNFSSDNHSVNIDCDILNTGDFPILYSDSSVNNVDTNRVIGSDVFGKYSNPSLGCDCSDVDVGFYYSYRLDVQLSCIATLRVRNINSGIEQDINLSFSDVYEYSSNLYSFYYNYGSNPNTSHISVTIPNANTFWTTIKDQYLEQNPQNEFVKWVLFSRSRIMLRFRPLSFRSDCNASPDCEDLRSSGSSESCHIILSTNDPSDTDFAQVSREFDLLFQPDAEHTSGEISFGGTTSDYLSFSAMYNAGARFDSSISAVRGEGSITVYAKIHAQCFVSGFESPVFGFMPYTGVKTKDTDEFILAQFVFNDPCCHVPTGFTSEKDTILQELVNWSNTLGATTVTGGYIEVTKIKWSGFERLTDYCCDESECSEYINNDLSIDLTLPCSGGSSGGGNVDITCICDELAKISQKLSVLNDRLLGIKTSIDEKELTVTVEPSTATVENTIQVEPTPITVNPSAVNPTIQVNPTPITVNPSAVNPTIQVNPTPITVNPSAVNPTIQVNPTPITVSPCQPDVVVNQGDVNVDNTALIQKLDELFKNDDDTITKVLGDSLKVTYQNDNGDVVTDGLAKVIKDKDFSNEVVCEVEKVDWAYEGYGNIRIPNDN